MVTEGTRVEAEAGEFYDRLARQLDAAYQLAGYLLGNAADAQDATQDAIAKAWSGFRSLRDPAAFESWFRRIVVNECRDRLRRRRRIRFVPLEDPDRDEAGLEAADPFATSLARDALGRALDALNPDERAIVVLHFWRGLSTAEIAELLHMRQGTVKYRLHTAYGAMRARLESSGKESPR